jgi:hypothetical protein
MSYSPEKRNEILAECIQRCFDAWHLNDAISRVTNKYTDIVEQRGICSIIRDALGLVLNPLLAPNERARVQSSLDDLHSCFLNILESDSLVNLCEVSRICSWLHSYCWYWETYGIL